MKRLPTQAAQRQRWSRQPHHSLYCLAVGKARYINILNVWVKRSRYACKSTTVWHHKSEKTGNFDDTVSCVRFDWRCIDNLAVVCVSFNIFLDYLKNRRQRKTRKTDDEWLLFRLLQSVFRGTSALILFLGSIELKREMHNFWHPTKNKHRSSFATILWLVCVCELRVIMQSITFAIALMFVITQAKNIVFELELTICTLQIW